MMVISYLHFCRYTKLYSYLSFYVSGQNATVKVVAGSLDFSSSFTDGVPATSARFVYVKGICLDSAGNMYILDAGAYRIRKMDALTQLVTTIAGNGTGGYSGDGGPAVLAQIGGPTDADYNYGYEGGICCDNSGNVYLADYYNKCIRKINTATGIITTIAGAGEDYAEYTNSLGASMYPNKICRDKAGNLYYTDTRAAVRKIDYATGLVHTLDGYIEPWEADEGFNFYTKDLTVDKNGNVYVTGNNFGGYSVVKIDTFGVKTYVGGDDWNPGFTGDGGPSVNALFNQPWGVATDTASNLYVADVYIIRKINKISGNINSIAGSVRLAAGYSVGEGIPFYSYSDEIPADSFLLNVSASPMCLAPSGDLYFVNAGTSILKLTQPAFSVDRAQIYDTITTPPCTLPAKHLYSFVGTLIGAPPVGDSLNVELDLHNGSAPSNYVMPYYSFVDTAGNTIYGFGGSAVILDSQTYTLPGTNTVTANYNTKRGNSDIITAIDTAGTICDGNISAVTLDHIKDTIVSAPCSSIARIRIDLDGSVQGTPSTSDSVYLLINYGDGSSDYHVALYDTIYSGGCFVSFHYHFHYSLFHDFPVGFTGSVRPLVNVIINSGRTAAYNINDGGGCSAYCPYLNIPNCSLPGILSSSIIPVDPAAVICTVPFTKKFVVGTSFHNSLVTTTGISYYVNFGDGSDTNVNLSTRTDGLGNYFTRDTVYHTYTIPGTYATAITPSDTSGATVGSTFTVSTSCSPLSGYFYRDANLNCNVDAGETKLAYWPMAVINNTIGDTTYAWCDSAGHFALTLIDGDSYSLIPNYFGTFGYGTDSFVLACPTAGVYSITPSVGASYSQNFGFTCAGAPTALDMSVSGWGWGFVPGDTGVIGIWASNAWGYMCDSLGATVTLTIDPLLTYLGMWDGPMPTTVSGSTLSWNFHTMANLLDFHADVKVRCATTATMGDVIHTVLHVSPTSIPDLDTANNTYSWQEPVRSSWDPNEKKVSPTGYGAEGYIPNGTPLNYVVHFQNTGTAQARNITINDTISSNLDIATLQIISSSSPVLLYQPELSGNLVKFRFNDINLPDSNTDFEGSNGYVEYSIVPRENLAAGTQIVNTAGIYFDYNPAVVTNTTINTIEDTLSSISGLATVCVGGNITLSNSLPGGAWYSSNTHATVAEGVVTGISTGIDTISYTAYGHLVVTKIITVNPLPDAGAVTGNSSLCIGVIVTLSSTTTGGTWSSSSSAATVVGGAVTGVAAGTSIISYAVTNSCGTATDTMMVTINALPTAGTITGIPVVCVSSAISLSNTTAIGTGTWSSSSSAATVSGGVVTGVADGSAIISYTASNTCGTTTDTMMITVNPLPTAGTITGTPTVCVAAATTLTNTTTGGTWSSSSSAATVSSGTVTGVTAGSAVISYAVTNTCGTATDTMMVTVNPLPNAGTITGTPTVCMAAAATLTNTTIGGTWSSSSSSATVAGGTVTGVAAGSAIISYAVTNTCGTATDTMMVTVNPLPNAGTITGTPTVCEAAITTLSNTATGGTWSSSSSAASVSGGTLTGVTSGSAVISYAVTNTCGTATDTMMITVNPLPNAGTITGTPTVCEAAITILSNTATGGTWNSSSSAATIAGGVLTGVATGSTTISYTVANSCGTATDTMMITVNPLPDAGTITGVATVCEAAVITLTNSAIGGVWSSSDVSKATINAGAVTGVSTGNVIISYAVTNTCGTLVATKPITIMSATTCGTGIGASVEAAMSYRLYPNPTNGSITVDMPGMVNHAVISVVDIYGKVLMTRSVEKQNDLKETLDLSNIASGTYLIKIDADGQQFRDKIVIW